MSTTQVQLLITSPFILALSVLALQWPRETTAFPTMPLSSLFANAVLRAQHLHLLASNTFKEFELDDGNAWGFQLLRRTYDKFDVNLQNKGSLLKNYRLLSCFKKDLHKVETYLKVMKCRRFGEINCTF
uniref:Growth hormone n=1 Tax=Salvator merianae TaxID=96440 RepID=A0A8D0BV97_SALMN